MSSVEAMERYNTIARKLDSHNTMLKEKALLTDVVTVNKELKAVSKVAHQAKSKGDKQGMFLPRFVSNHLLNEVLS